ncbi:MAG TPA: alanine racemase [Thermoleophilia bacterium]|nr:alanine racemase [Thermoleophilia bacterium]
MADPPWLRPTWAEIDLDAIRHNTALLAAHVAPAQLCAVVKAWAYGHGPVEVSRAAIEGGATWLAVALVEEGSRLRRAGIEAPILVLSEPPAAAMVEVAGANLTPTLYTVAGAEAAAAAARAVHRSRPLPVHVKVDTGMHRVGTTAAGALDVADAVNRTPELLLEGLWTHLAVADEPEDAYTGEQLEAFAKVAGTLDERGMRPALLHAANSAGAIWHPGARLDMVRCGIAMYGLAPALGRPGCEGLRPAMALKSRVSYVKPLAAGQRVSYGLNWRAGRDTVLATVPLGYADGVPRRLSANGGDALIGGRRCPMAGTITMDQLMVDCGPGADVRPGDEVVLIGRQGNEEITAWEWAERCDTIGYEVVCGVSARVPRIYLP